MKRNMGTAEVEKEEEIKQWITLCLKSLGLPFVINRKNGFDLNEFDIPTVAVEINNREEYLIQYEFDSNCYFILEEDVRYSNNYYEPDDYEIIEIRKTEKMSKDKKMSLFFMINEMVKDYNEKVFGYIAESQIENEEE